MRDAEPGVLDAAALLLPALVGATPDGEPRAVAAQQVVLGTPRD